MKLNPADFPWADGEQLDRLQEWADNAGQELRAMRHWKTTFHPDDGEPIGEVCSCEIGEDHDGAGQPNGLVLHNHRDGATCPTCSTYNRD